MKRLLLPLLALILILAACDLYTYGQLGGADQTDILRPGNSVFSKLLSSFSGVWYSHYAGIGRLDGYRIIKWSDFLNDEKSKARATLIFPDFAPGVSKTYDTKTLPGDDDYLVLYDDTVYGQADDEDGLQASWGFGYAGIVRAINIFNGDRNRGAIIIEYIENCAPEWLDGWGVGDGKLPFFGIYYRVLDSDTIQMANAVDLAALYKGAPYHTETATLDEAIEKNNVENEAEFIAWGVVIPQNREK
ncbi:MAG: hypothetical protein LBD44_06050 [Spirochaetaceae bacterium]|nr:hypothetical protein [Spirochaetaceae bacterium]